MNPSPNHVFPNPLRHAADSPGEDTLHLIASLPAPVGLSERVQAGLRANPKAGRIMMARGPLQSPFGWMYSGLVRGAAAAAIVCVVAGGGWQIYSHVQPAGSAKIVVMPAPASPGGSGFSSAGAKRVPQTLEGPVLTHPVPAFPEVNVVDKRSAQPTAPTNKKRKRVTHSSAVPMQ